MSHRAMVRALRHACRDLAVFLLLRGSVGLDGSSFHRVYEDCGMADTPECFAVLFRFSCHYPTVCQIDPLYFKRSPLARRLSGDTDSRPAMAAMYAEFVDSLRMLETTWDPSSLPFIGPVIGSLLHMAANASLAGPEFDRAFTMESLDASATPRQTADPHQWDPLRANVFGGFPLPYEANPLGILTGSAGTLGDSMRGLTEPLWPALSYSKLFDTVAKMAMLDPVGAGLRWAAPANMPVNAATGAGIPALHPNLPLNGGLRGHPDDLEPAKAEMVTGLEGAGTRNSVSLSSEPPQWSRASEDAKDELQGFEEPSSLFDPVSANVGAGAFMESVAQLADTISQRLGIDEDVQPQQPPMLPDLPVNVRSAFSTVELMNAVENKAIEFLLSAVRPMVKASSISLASSQEVQKRGTERADSGLWARISQRADSSEGPLKRARRLQRADDLGALLEQLLVPTDAGSGTHMSSENLPWVPLDNIAGTLPGWFAEALMGPYALLFQDLVKVTQEAYVRMQLVVDAFADEPIPVSSEELQQFTNQMSEAFRANLPNDEANAIRSVALTVKKLPTLASMLRPEGNSTEDTIDSVMAGYDALIQSLRKLTAEPSGRAFEGLFGQEADQKLTSDTLPWLPLDSIVASYGGFLADKSGGAGGQLMRKIARAWTKGSEKLDEMTRPFVGPLLGYLGDEDSNGSSVPEQSDRVLRDAPKRQQRYVSSAGAPMSDEEFYLGSWMAPDPSMFDAPVTSLMPAGHFVETISQDLVDLPSWLGSMLEKAVDNASAEVPIRRLGECDDCQLENKLNRFGIPLGSLLSYLGVPIEEFQHTIEDGTDVPVEGQRAPEQATSAEAPPSARRNNQPPIFRSTARTPEKGVDSFNPQPKDDEDLEGQADARAALMKLVDKARAKKAARESGLQLNEKGELPPPIFANPSLYGPIPGWTEPATKANMKQYMANVRNYIKNPLGTVRQTLRDNYRSILWPNYFSKDGMDWFVMNETEIPAKPDTTIYLPGQLPSTTTTHAPTFTPVLVGQQQPEGYDDPPLFDPIDLPDPFDTLLPGPDFDQLPIPGLDPFRGMEQLPGLEQLNQLIAASLESLERLQDQWQDQVDEQLRNSFLNTYFRNLQAVESEPRISEGESHPMYSITNSFQNDFVFRPDDRVSQPDSFGQGSPGLGASAPPGLPSELQTLYSRLEPRQPNIGEEYVALPVPRALTLDEIAADPDAVNRAVSEYLQDWQHYVDVVQGRRPGTPEPISKVVEDVVKSLQDSVQKLTANEIFEDASFGLQKLLVPPASEPLFISSVPEPVSPKPASLKKMVFEVMDNVNRITSRNGRDATRLMSHAADDLGLLGTATDRPSLLLLPLLAGPWTTSTPYRGPASTDHQAESFPRDSNTLMGSILPDTLFGDEDEAAPGRRLQPGYYWTEWNHPRPGDPLPHPEVRADAETLWQPKRLNFDPPDAPTSPENARTLKELQSVFDMLVSALQTGYDTLKSELADNSASLETSSGWKGVAKQGASSVIQRVADGIVSSGPKIKEPDEQEAFTEDVTALEKRDAPALSGSVLPQNHRMVDYLAERANDEHLFIPERNHPSVSPQPVVPHTSNRNQRDMWHEGDLFDDQQPFVIPYDSRRMGFERRPRGYEHRDYEDQRWGNW